MIKTISLKICITIVSILLIDLFLLIYFKYHYHNLSLNIFSLFRVGNILNVLFTAFLIIGLITIHIRKIRISIVTLFFFIIILNICLLIVYVTNFITAPSIEYYLLNLSFSQILIIGTFSLFQFTQFVMLMSLWQEVLKVKTLKLLRAVVNSIFVAAGLFVFTLIFINSGRLSSSRQYAKEKTYDVAVVLGAAVWSNNIPSPTLALRVDKAAELYRKKLVKKIQFTGGNAPGELSEAEVSRNYILSKGINSDDIWIEKNTTSTIEQIRFIKNKLLAVSQAKSIAIISDIYHLQRVKEICKFYNLNADTIPSDLYLKSENLIFYQIRECTALLLFWLYAL